MDSALHPPSLKATKEVFLQLTISTNATNNAYDGATGWFSRRTLTSTETTRTLWHVPNDFNSLIDAAMVVIPDATETIQWDLDISVAAVGEIYNNDDRQALNESQAVTVNLLTELDISGSMAGLSPGDYVGINFASDTSNIRTIGVRVRYQ